VRVRYCGGLLLTFVCIAVLATPTAAKETRLAKPPLGAFTEPRGLAVDQGSHDVYAIDGRSEVQQVMVSASAGKFKLQFIGGEAELDFNAKASEVRDALRAMACGGAACVIVNGGPGGSNPYVVEFVRALDTTDVEQIGCVDGNPPLTGGSGCSVKTIVNGVSGTIARYHADGTPSNFTDLGTNVIDGKGPGADLTPQGGLHFSVPKLVQLAVDESSGAIYATQFGDRLVDIFSTSGEFKGQLTEYKEGAVFKPLGEVCGVAVDSFGNVYVADLSAIHKYDPASDPVKNADSVANFATVASPCALGAGVGPTAGFLFAGRLNEGLFKLDATSGAVKYEVSASLVTTVTVDPTSGHVLTAEGASVKEFDASGTSSATLLGTIAAGSEVRGVAVDGTTGKGGTIYLSRAGATHLDAYGPIVHVPDVVTQGASKITGTTATLNGTIGADNGPGASCHFEYVEETAYQANIATAKAEGLTTAQIAEAAFAGAQSAPCEPAGPFTGAAVNPVHADVLGLALETEYEFRLVGTNSNGSIAASAESFETQGKPVVEGGSASQVTATSALISGAVNPRGSETEAAVELVTEEQFEASGFAEAGTVPASTLPGFVTGTGNLAHATGTGNTIAGSVAVTGVVTESGEFEVGETIVGAAIPAETKVLKNEPGGLVLTKAANRTIGSASGKGDLSEGSATVENPIASNGSFTVGQTIVGAGIPPGTTIISCTPEVVKVEEGIEQKEGICKNSTLSEPASLTLSAPVQAGATASGVTLTAFPLFTATSNTIKNLQTSAGRFGPGQAISGPGIAPGTTVLEAQAGQLLLSKPATERVLGASLLASGPQPVSVKLDGLTPETRYVFRLIAQSSAGAGDPGEPGRFSTLPLLGPPLPDGRAYEMVTPAVKEGDVYVSEPSQRDGLGGSCANCTPGSGKPRMAMQASPSGEALAFEGDPFEEGLASGANEYRARRGSGGWQTAGLSAPGFGDGRGEGFKAFAADLSRAILVQAASLSPEAPQGFTNLYLQEEGKEAELRALVTVEPPNRSPESGGANAFGVSYAGANAGTEGVDPFSHVIFQANDALTPEEVGIAPEAPPVSAEETNLYEWSGEELQLVNVLPGNAEAAPDAVFGSGHLLALGGGENFDFDHAISDDGNRIFWSSKPGGQVYVREGGTTTTEIPDPGKFITATPDGDKVLLSDGVLYDLESATPTDLTGGEGGFQGTLGASEDLSRIYFVDTKALTPAEEENANGEAAEEGKPNLYLWEEGSTSFIARLLPSDNALSGATLGAWHAAPDNRLAQVSADGRFLAFESRAPLTGYDSSIAGGTGCLGVFKQDLPQCFEVFEYDAQSKALTCPSCKLSGEAPLGLSNLTLILGENEAFAQPDNLPPEGEGRLFFESQDALLQRDVNGNIQDVYEWEPNGVGACERPRGCLSLISSGSSPKDSHFISASANGNDVFFVTRDQLVARDKDEFLDVYDARVGGGFAEGEDPGPCAGEACAAPIPPPPPFESPSSSASHSPEGKPRPHCRRGYVRRGARCVRKPHKPRRHHRAGKHQRGGRR
jgi:hypothetical protein